MSRNIDILKNMELLKNIQYPLTLISDNNKLQEMDDNYDGLNSLKSLEYAIYYTFHEAFDIFNKSWNYKEKKKILTDLDIILDNLYLLKETKINKITGEEEPNLDYGDTDIIRFGNADFNTLFDLLSYKYYLHFDDFHQNKCKNIISHSFNSFCELLLQSKEYLYKHDTYLIDFTFHKYPSSDDNTDDNTDVDTDVDTDKKID